MKNTYVFDLGSSGVTGPRFIIMEYVWQILSERSLFETPSFSPICGHSQIDPPWNQLKLLHWFQAAKDYYLAENLDNLTFCFGDITELLFWIFRVFLLPPD